ncbi:hypothetical protein E2P81_ATG05217 [Venturia nashicola]|uniref:Uncharacterized protein n=1 Tax=Venturia nashicola TaxID=86259 RepID=A0A4Z1PF50_9PEZI|nr:hypothetical protein E6O75_ATG05346 [Venturia nashicola]TLD32241.1 hypothetical protein E2P81_ATG05217 [Venturia nashicola]
MGDFGQGGNGQPQPLMLLPHLAQSSHIINLLLQQTSSFMPTRHCTDSPELAGGEAPRSNISLHRCPGALYFCALPPGILLPCPRPPVPQSLCGLVPCPVSKWASLRCLRREVLAPKRMDCGTNNYAQTVEVDDLHGPEVL